LGDGLFLAGWAKAINPFVRNLQNNLQESYFQDFLVACPSKSSAEDSKSGLFSGVGRDVLLVDSSD
jgi:hypothetical protein